ncbi:hypothetical protein TNCV_1764811 [Trichonephila clavipes]|nr:hypothetical protein TNCV_1764811 [Trichonephila clavipes]
MLSMLEGNVMNGTIGKQMVDTFVESANNVEWTADVQEEAGSERVTSCLEGVLCDVEPCRLHSRGQLVRQMLRLRILIQ